MRLLTYKILLLSIILNIICTRPLQAPRNSPREWPTIISSREKLLHRFASTCNSSNCAYSENREKNDAFTNFFFNVLDYGAVGDAVKDNTMPFTYFSIIKKNNIEKLISTITHFLLKNFFFVLNY